MTSGRSTYLVDSNVLLYAYDASEGAKRDRAIDVIERLAESRTGVLSVQVLGEFYVNAIGKIRPPMQPEEAAQRIAHYMRAWPIFDLTSSSVAEAVRCSREHQLSYWDALVWAAAKLNGVPNVLTEDMQSLGIIGGVTIVNPFSPSFDPAVLQ